MLNLLSSPRRLMAITFLFSVGFLVVSPMTAETPPEPNEQGSSLDNQLLLRTTTGKLSDLTTRYGLNVLKQHDQEFALVEAPDDASIETLTTTIASDIDVEDVEMASLASLPRRQAGASLAMPTAHLWQNLQRSGTASRRCLSGTALGDIWSGYTDQWALDVVNLPEAQLVSPSCGAGVTVAVIDTGVDPEHPALRDALLPGYDYLIGQSGAASEWNSLEQSVQAILEENLRAFAAQSVQAILEGDGDLMVVGPALGVVLDPAMTVSLEGEDLDSYFGHGTMVAGIIRLAAPEASIMPLRVFNGSGSAHLYDIVDAIYYAVDHGADVINMSFSMAEPSKELKRALKYARQHGVVTVAAAGNEGDQATVYPAAFGRSVGVASTSETDQLSEFSNYGTSLVKLAAPGEGIISAFPGDHYAAGWGTSFATPLVTGTVALLYPLYGIEDDPERLHELLNALYKGSERLEIGNLIGRGRLDSLGSFLEAASCSE